MCGTAPENGGSYLDIEPLLAKRISVVGLDVDGVLTDGGVYVGAVQNQPVEFIRFHSQDSLGIRLLRTAGIKVVLMSGRTSSANQIRASEIGVDELIQDDMARKLPVFEGVLLRIGGRLNDASYIGHDLSDLPLLQRVGLPVATSSAVPEVREVSRCLTQASGGHGAVREFSERLLRARGEWHKLVDDYLKQRSSTQQRVTGAF